MLKKEDLREYTSKLKFNMAQVERDYLQHLFLSYLYNITDTDFVFKGGTALQKCSDLNRFSEDLDFTFQGDSNIISDVVYEVAQNMTLLYDTQVEIPKQRIKINNSKQFHLKIKGPLFTEQNINFSLTTLRIDVSLRESILSDPLSITIRPIYKTISPFDVFLMSYEEILAEKFRAVISRNKARDVYDLWFLLKKSIKVNMDFIKEKLQTVDLTYSHSLLLEKMNEKRPLWDKELTILMINTPEFELVFEEITSYLK